MSNGYEYNILPEIAEQLLEKALPGAEHKVCARHREASHACAVAAGGYAIHRICQMIAWVRNQLATRELEMHHEEVFSADKLREHLRENRRMAAHLLALAQQIGECCYPFLPSAETLRARVVKARYLLLNEVVARGEELLRPDQPVPLAEQAVRELVTRRGPTTIEIMLEHPEMLARAMEDARNLDASLRTDWDWDRACIKSDPMCRTLDAGEFRDGFL